ncbi:hypothetical protein BpHYR1_008927 [Brachionus plicatilis]|uniref:Uncharacterized protein n=1 Tax=Brachionus plicatilis TaxID=10195 RepID=A0A3M7RKM1_BRAPC|nr:hypothetical protein BpHYR1_008927 [Brachionus plicatilis]
MIDFVNSFSKAFRRILCIRENFKLLKKKHLVSQNFSNNIKLRIKKKFDSSGKKRKSYDDNEKMNLFS